MSLMYIAFFECVAIVWIYGTKRLSANIKDMSGNYPNAFCQLCWKYISPLLIMVRSSKISFKKTIFLKKKGEDRYLCPNYFIFRQFGFSAY